MPNLDVAKIALILILVAALVGVGVWFADTIVPDIVLTGAEATAALDVHGAPAWALVVGLFGASWGKAWGIALGFVVLTGSVFFVLRLIKWVQG